MSTHHHLYDNKRIIQKSELGRKERIINEFHRLCSDKNNPLITSGEHDDVNTFYYVVLTSVVVIPSKRNCTNCSSRRWKLTALNKSDYFVGCWLLMCRNRMACISNARVPFGQV